MKRTLVYTTTVDLIPRIYYRTNPDAFGIGWLGRAIEWDTREESPTPEEWGLIPVPKDDTERMSSEEYKRKVLKPAGYKFTTRD